MPDAPDTAAPAPARPGILGSLLIGGTRLPWLAEPLLLTVRLYVGYTMMRAGLDKLPTPDWMVDQVAQMGWFPAEPFFASVACLSEFIGGALLCLGLLTRPAAWFVAFTMGVAAFSFQQQTPIVGGIHVAQMLCWLSVVFLGIGSGRLSLDAFIRAVLLPREAAEPKRTQAALLLTALLALPIFGYGFYLELFTEPPAPVATADAEVTAVSVAGSFNEWDVTADPLALGDNGAWSGVIEVSQPGPVAFKFAANDGWAINLGDNDPGTAGFPITGTGEPDGDNIAAYLPAAGTYRVTVNLDTGTYSLVAEGAEELPEPESEPTPN